MELKQTVLVLFVTMICPSQEIQHNSTVSNTTSVNFIQHRFLNKLFLKYGSENWMTFEGFEHLLFSLGLGHLIIDDHDINEHKNGDKFEELHPHHDHVVPQKNQSKSTADNDRGDGDSAHKNDQHNHEHNKRSVRIKRGVELKKCLTAVELLSNYGIERENGLSRIQFLAICPAVIDQLDEKLCKVNRKEYKNRFTEETNRTRNTSNGKKINSWDLFSIPPKVWGCAVAAVVVISLAGLVGVAAVPLMRQVFYSHVLHFLVALAVGSLTGDAALHLLPHALQTHTDDGGEGHDKSGVIKGAIVLAGIYFFFLAEQLMAIFTQWKRNKLRKKKLDNEEINMIKKYDSYQYTKDIGVKLSKHDQHDLSCEDIIIVQPDKDAQDIPHRDHDDKSNTDDVSHSHGHSHGDGKVPKSVAAVAWMVIMGDGLHNFSDGLAIGAAFASSITGGISTSIAVFCHELPHELGDFAMLLRAGMSVKQAVAYNLVSSVLCFIGMVIGVALGNIKAATSWIFAGCAGMFIYIALVDMLPEITSKESKISKSKWCHLLLQFGGILIGSSIMLIIAVFEDKIKTAIGG